MTEEKVKKRGWIKNAAIIFLALLLVLTLFSNTFMNRSLPEVATQNVTAGMLAEQIRGTGTVTAEESFEVKTSQSRTVLSVPVKVGDAVSVGDTLILFSDADSEELKTAQDTLDDLVLAYQKALLNASSGQYSEQRRAVQDAQDALDAAKRLRDENQVSNDDVINAQNAVDTAQTNRDLAEEARDNAQTALAALGEKTEGTTGDYAPVQAALTKLNEANNNLSAVKLYHKANLDLFETAAKSGMEAHNTANPNNKVTLAVYKERLAMEYSVFAPPAMGSDDRTGDEKKLYDQYLAYSAVKEAEDAVKTAQSVYDTAVKIYNEGTKPGNVAEYNRRNAALTTAKNNLAAAEKTLTSAQNALTKIKEKKEAYDTAVASVTTCQKDLQSALFNLEKSAATENLDFQDMKKGIDRQNEVLAGLQSGGDGSEVKSQVNGIVASVAASAGKTTTPDEALMVVEVPDMGYTVSFSVTKEQSQKVKPGDPADIMYNYWGSNKSATLAAIRTDPANPGTNKMLVFKVTGDVESGESLSLSIGGRGSTYDAIVPNSALRTDANGSFVLIVTAKNSALGNRYTATRVDVQVLASDDNSTAVSGGLTTSDFVITTSSAPIEPGMLVRLPDNV